MASSVQFRDKLENQRSQNDKMSALVWQKQPKEGKGQKNDN